MPAPNALRDCWQLDPAVAFLNHGSFGACPTRVLEAQAELRSRLEREPVRFFVRELPGLQGAARAEVAAFVGARPEDLAFVRNATAGVNAVLRSLELEPGDEVLTTDHEYNACRNALDFAAARRGARVVVARVPFPLADPDAAAAAVLAAAGPKTRLALLDHVTSPTALVLPVARLVADLRARGVETLVDGAHAPGMVDLDVERLGAAFYVANCHKWLCAPKGAGFLWARRDRQAGLHPTSISHGLNAPPSARSRFQVEFDWTGTDDPTPALCVPEAIRFMGALLPGGWPEVRARNHALALEARDLLAATLGVAPPCPDEMVGAMAALPLPDGSPEPPPSALYMDELQNRLLDGHGVEVPVIPWPAPPRRLLRVSAQVYNTIDDFRRLAAVLPRLLTRLP
jgi:isopenicillin-N epimerase